MNGGSSQRGVVTMPKVRVVPVVTQYLLNSDASTTWIYIDLDLPEVALWGPYLESITAHCDTVNRTPQFQWKIVTYYSTDGVKWSQASDVFAAITANGPSIPAAYTGVQTFGLHLRFALAASNISGTAAEHAFVTCALAFQFRS